MSELLSKGRDSERPGIPASFSSAPPPIPAQKPTSSGRGALLGYTIFALALALCIRFFVAAPYVVQGSSMDPNFANWDYLITDRISYRFENPERGDVVVFHLPQEYSRTLIKRIIGLPGETVSVDSNGIRISTSSNPEGFLLEEPYLAAENIGGPNNITITLEYDEYAVLGDNRRVSSDSRTWGPLPRDHIVGRVLLRLFPITKLGILPAEARYLE